MSQVQGFDFDGAIQRVIAEFESAARAKNAAGMAAFYTDDATLLPPGSPLIRGRANIQAFWQSFLDAGAAEPTLKTVSVEASGETAYEIGTYDAIVPDATGGTSRSSGKYLVVWKRQADGNIKMAADMFSGNS